MVMLPSWHNSSSKLWGTAEPHDVGWLIYFFVWPVCERYYKDWREISDKGPSSVDWESLDTLNLEMLNTHLLQFFDGKVRPFCILTRG